MKYYPVGSEVLMKVYPKVQKGLTNTLKLKPELGKVEYVKVKVLCHAWIPSCGKTKIFVQYVQRLDTKEIGCMWCEYLVHSPR